MSKYTFKSGALEFAVIYRFFLVSQLFPLPLSVTD